VKPEYTRTGCLLDGKPAGKRLVSEGTGIRLYFGTADCTTVLSIGTMNQAEEVRQIARRRRQQSAYWH
jgi:putative component of toxin-antitoxin plasmid stabilization module